MRQVAKAEKRAGSYQDLGFFANPPKRPVFIYTYQQVTAVEDRLFFVPRGSSLQLTSTPTPTTSDAKGNKTEDDFDPARALIEEALRPVAAELKTLSTKLEGYIPAEAQSAKAVLQHVFRSGGKRIRPALYFLCCRMLGYEGEHLYPIAAVTEFVHTASLLHDDVVDNSTIRRNKPTANSIYGDETSVLVGDLIYSTASEMMAATGNMEIVKTFARAIRLMSDGELLQLENLFKPDIPESTYFRILECKTATLIAAACRSAGLLKGLSTDRCEALAHFGHQVGMAFQLIDDALDYTGSSIVVGKDTLLDLREGKITMPLILLFQKMPKDQAQALKQKLATDALDPASIQEVAKLVAHYDTAEQSVERAHEFTLRAMDTLATFPASPHRDALENLANRLLFRFN